MIITITLLLYQLQYYSRCYYKFWQYYAKYAYHADKLSHSHSCLLENVNSKGGGACPHPPSLPPPHRSHVSQPKTGESGNVSIYWTPCLPGQLLFADSMDTVKISKRFAYDQCTKQMTFWEIGVYVGLWSTAHFVYNSGGSRGGT